MNQILRIASLSLAAFLAFPTLYALPAMLTLPVGRRPGLTPLTIPQAAELLKASGKTGWDLVEAARLLVAERMAYCRRNSFDRYQRAFERGYGYCQQHAFALADLLTRLGFEARVVNALSNRFPNGAVGGHAWVNVSIDGQNSDVDSLWYDRQVGRLDFVSLTNVFEITPLFRLFAGWGSAVVNAHRYYRTGKDH